MTNTPSPTRPARDGLRWAAAGLALAGAGALAYGLATPAKAWVGQLLLERAFEAAQARAAAGGGADGSGGPADASGWARPWPWADTGPVARLSFPSLGAERLVLARADGEGMAWGPGHVAGTAPLGAPGVSAAAAHRDTHFALLADLRPGDVVELETLDGRSARYRVRSGRVVDARSWRFPAVFDGPDVLALSTCWPFGSLTPGPDRFVLFATRVEERA